MQRNGLYLSIFILAICGMNFCGCTDSSKTSPTNNSSTDDGDDHDDHSHDEGSDHGHDEDGDHGHDEHGDDDHDGHDHSSTDSSKTDMEKMEKGLANLSEADRASAMKQHVCPVTNEMLGTMGEPIKVTVKDQDVWVCCKSCKRKILKSPEEYLAKLNK